MRLTKSELQLPAAVGFSELFARQGRQGCSDPLIPGGPREARIRRIVYVMFYLFIYRDELIISFYHGSRHAIMLPADELLTAGGGGRRGQMSRHGPGAAAAAGEEARHHAAARRAPPAPPAPRRRPAPGQE